MIRKNYSFQFYKFKINLDKSINKILDLKGKHINEKVEIKIQCCALNKI